MIDNAQREGGDGLGFEQEEGAREEDADGQEGRRQGQQELLTDGGRRESAGPVSWAAYRGSFDDRRKFRQDKNGTVCIVSATTRRGIVVVPFETWRVSGAQGWHTDWSEIVRVALERLEEVDGAR